MESILEIRIDNKLSYDSRGIVDDYQVTEYNCGAAASASFTVNICGFAAKCITFKNQNKKVFKKIRLQLN